MSNAWAKHYADIATPREYGDPQSYALTAWWLRDCDTIDDWGCGLAGLRLYLGDGHRYSGIDGSPGPYTDHVTDLAEWRGTADGIVLRHVLEHNEAWQAILDNAIGSFMKRLCIVVFTPLVGATHRLATEDDYEGVPVMAFALDDLRRPFIAAGITHDMCTLSSPWSHYGTETLIYAQRS